MTITIEQLAEWERLAAEATPGPWLLDRYGVVSIDEATIRAAGGRWLIRAQIAAILGIPDDLPEGHVEKNAAFIAAARSAVPALVAEVRTERAKARECPACEKLAHNIARAEAAETEVRALRDGLKAICVDPHQAYEHGYVPDESEATRQYRIGVADGHRCAAATARAALATVPK